MNRPALVLFSSLVLLALPACKKLIPGGASGGKPGDACQKEGSRVCQDDKNALVCLGGKYELQPCRGLNGCMNDGAACTNAGYLEGEPCLEEGNYECTTDKKAMLQCSTKHWKPVEKCLGQNGCVANAQGAKCDNSTSEVGAPCQKEDTYACTVDKKTLLRCTSGKLVAHATCPGMHNCRKQFDRIECNGETPIKK